MTSILTPLSALNSFLLTIGRNIAWIALAGMVIVILLQIFYRYALNNALPWPEEAARALMIWMMALIAPSAFRHAGFVAIDMVPDLLPRKVQLALRLFILVLSLIVIVIMLGHAWAHFSAPLLFDSSGLNRLLQDSGINQLLGTQLQFRTAYVYLAMSVLLALMILVSLELLLRLIGRILYGDEAFPEPVLPKSMEGS
ncbi:MAG: TRAP transporter small permease subunit [Ahrensia sp.]|nr:TRAP transporter small permease subunit [Ahrensia sp.]